MGLKVLSDEQRVEVYKLHAEGLINSEIVKYLADAYGVSITAPSIFKILHTETAKVQIKRFREDYIKRVKDVPMANKRIRLDDLQIIRDKLMKQIKGNPCETKAQRDEFRRDSRSLSEIVNSSRDEMEKKVNLVPGFGVIGDFEDKTDEQLIAERDELVRQAEKSLASRVTAIDIDPEGASGPDQTESA